MKRTKSGMGPMASGTLRLNGETVRKLSVLGEGQLHQAAGGTVGDTSTVQSLCNFCWEDTVYCPA